MALICPVHTDTSSCVQLFCQSLWSQGPNHMAIRGCTGGLRHLDSGRAAPLALPGPHWEVMPKPAYFLITHVLLLLATWEIVCLPLGTLWL